MGMVCKASTTEWPSGCADLVIDAMFKKYVPQDIMSRVELRRAMNKIRMKKREDPANLFEQISALENKYNTATYTLPDDELIAAVLENASV